jgi:hypothetical protein
MRVVGVMLLAAMLGGCFNMVPEVRTQKIRVEATPPGTWVQKIDSTGTHNVGQAPVVVEQSYGVTVKRYKHWNWLWTVLSAAGMGTFAISDDSGKAVGGVCAGGFLVSLIANIVGAVRSGKEQPVTPQPVRLTAFLDGYTPRYQTVAVPGPMTAARFTLSPGQLRGTPPPPPRPAPAVGATKGKTFIVAVFDVEDAASRFKEKTLSQLTDYLAARITEAGYRVVPRNQLRARLVEEKKEGYKTCFDETCQIELGKAVAAQKSLSTKLLQVGTSCAISSTLFDLKTETTERAASVRTDCSENGLMEGLEKIARQLATKK